MTSNGTVALIALDPNFAGALSMRIGVSFARSTTDMAHSSTASGVSIESGATIRLKAITRP
jgi:hypothetical protein